MQILRHCDPASLQAMRDVGPTWDAAATPSVIRSVLSSTGASRGVAIDSPDCHLQWAINNRVIIIERHMRRSYTVPSAIWDFDCASLSPDLGMLIGNTDGFVLNAFDLEDDRVNALFGDWEAFPIGWAADNSQLICRDHRRQLISVEPADPSLVQRRVLRGSREGAISGWDLSRDRRWAAAAGRDGRNWVVSLETQQVAEFSRTSSHEDLCPPVCIRFVCNDEYLLHPGPGRFLWLTDRNEVWQSRRVQGLPLRTKLKRLGCFTRMEAQKVGGSVETIDFSCWPPKRRKALAEKEEVRQLRVLADGRLWLTRSLKGCVNLWRFDGTSAQHAWRFDFPRRKCQKLFAEPLACAFGILDDTGVLHLFSARHAPPWRLGRLTLLENERPWVSFSHDDTHVVITKPGEDVFVKRIVTREGLLSSLRRRFEKRARRVP